MSLLLRADEAKTQIDLLTRRADADLQAIWGQVDKESADNVRDFMLRFFPELVNEYFIAGTALAADLYDDWREAANAAGAFAAVTLADPAVDLLEANVRWALGSIYKADQDWDAALVNLSGSLNRHVADGHRNTIETSARTDPARVLYARHASANACGFCKMLATRSAVYTSESAALNSGTGRVRGKRGAKEKYHDHCHCTAVAVFPGDQYEEAPHVARWRQEYADGQLHF